MTLLTLLPVAAVLAGGGSAPHAVSPPQADAPVRLTLRIPDGRRQFRPGEIITFELEFSSATSGRFVVDGATYDRSGRLTIEEFAIDRIDDVSDPMLDYFGSIAGFAGGGVRGVGVLGDAPFRIQLQLNAWFRFDKPGPYTLAVRSHRVTDESVTPPAVVAVDSNTITFELLPREAVWEAAALATARRILDATPPRPDVGDGCRMLRFLGTDAAAVEMIRRYGDGAQGCDFDYMAGLFGTVNRAAAVAALEAGLRAVDQPVTGSYLRTLSALSAYLRYPELRPAQTSATKGRLPDHGPPSQLQNLIDAALSQYRDVLSAAVPGKSDRARAITLTDARTLASPPPAGGSAATRAQAATDFLALPVERQVNLLEFQWSSLAGPAMLPALRRLIATAPPDAPSAHDLALRRLAQLAPDEARPLILREIRRPRAGATLTTLGSLPDAELPELDDVLAANFEADPSVIRASLVHRYASRAIAPRILASAGNAIGRMPCDEQASILAYFLRVDEATRSSLLDRAMASRATGCWTLLDRIAARRMTPAVQARAIADLDAPDADVVIAAIRTLGAHGSPAALEPLRAAFLRWNATWASRASELVYSQAVERPHARQAMVEDAFRQAIGAGHAWLARASDVRELQRLCVTDTCRIQTTHMIRDDDTTIVVWHINAPDDCQIELAQYHITSIAALEEKVAQYPRGTAFTLQTSISGARVAADVLTRLRAFAAAHGLSLTER